MNQLQHALDACYRTKSIAIREVLLTALEEEGNIDKEFSMFAAALIEANQRK
ncbi:hypothetical protein FHW67_001958 [Herbaspirillum sp. Sphag1AN]|uniref:hypothetical protein n=1 Tax=unclassified Herbaspirillum TaxID=2624150 RepID=UPI001791D39C|nr:MULTISPECIES: hypothetical protein [unclassified Herbaspirillum]MBB3212675.1 hypothetical protein [Herbaspirillum sp. Sphag1AN]MBB3245872.1 hypothetical protein [Herbaspirillum sp. Sphag64]